MSLVTKTTEPTAKTVDYSDYILFVETMHGNTIKTLVEALKNLVPDVNITFNHKTFGILRMNDVHTLLVFLTMFAEEFENGYYILEPFVAGVNVQYLYKAIKTVAAGDILRLVITKNDPNTLLVLVNNAKEGQFVQFDVPLMDINEDEVGAPEMGFTFMITMDPTKFGSIASNMKAIGVDLVQITYSKEGLEFRGKGEFPVKYLLKPGEDKLEIQTNGQLEGAPIYQGLFELDKLVKFTKCTGLSDQVKLLLMNDYPLIAIYDVGGLGEIKLCLAPAINPDD
jgi:proliferating cell nuclear antigen